MGALWSKSLNEECKPTTAKPPQSSPSHAPIFDNRRHLKDLIFNVSGICIAYEGSSEGDVLQIQRRDAPSTTAQQPKTRSWPVRSTRSSRLKAEDTQAAVSDGKFFCKEARELREALNQAALKADILRTRRTETSRADELLRHASSLQYSASLLLSSESL